jgi:hypothetical protein
VRGSLSIAVVGVLLMMVGCSPGEDSEPVSSTQPTVDTGSVLPATPTSTSAASQDGSCAPLAQVDIVNGATLPEDTCYLVEGSLSVDGGELVIRPGVLISFGDRGVLTINSGGQLNAQGTAEKPITFTSVDAAGSWRGIHFNASASASNMLHNVTIENGGSAPWTGDTRSRAALYLSGNTVIDIQHSTISGSGGQAIHVHEGVVMTFEGNTLEGNAVAAWVHPDTAGFISGDTVFAGNAANVVRVVFGNNDAVTTAQTWQAGVPFEIQDRFFIRAPLTLEPGAHITMRADTEIRVIDGGSITADGTAEAPIVFTSAEDLPGYWKGLLVGTQAVANRFNHTTFENGGSLEWTGGTATASMVRLDGNSKTVFTNSTFRGSGNYGLWVPEGGDISGFEGNTFTGNSRAMYVHPNRAGAIAANNSFAGNANDRVWVSTGNNDTVTTAQTWQNFGTPFYLTTRVWVNASLSIAAGTVVEFAQNASLEVSSREAGSLRGAGTADAPVIFRGGEDLPGYWKGIAIGTASADNLLEHVVIRNAGSQDWFGGGNAASAIYIINGSAALDNVTFESTNGFAIIVLGDGSISCSTVDLGGLGYWDQTGSQPTEHTVCPAPS